MAVVVLLCLPYSWPVMPEIFLIRGWRVFPVVRKASVIPAYLAEHQKRCCPVVADVAKDEAVSAITTALSRGTNSLDVLINNAGILGWTSRIDDVSPKELLALIDIHCVGALRCTKAAFPYLRAADNPIMVNITSRYGSVSRNASGDFRNNDGQVMYSYRIAKAAQNMLTLCLSQELDAYGIRVCAVHPGRLKTACGPLDADTEPSEAAHKLFEWIENADRGVNGCCFDLSSGGKMQW